MGVRVGDVWYTVVGDFYGITTHDTLESAKDRFEQIKDNDWSFAPRIVEHKVIKTKE